MFDEWASVDLNVGNYGSWLKLLLNSSIFSSSFSSWASILWILNHWSWRIWLGYISLSRECALLTGGISLSSYRIYTSSWLRLYSRMQSILERGNQGRISGVNWSLISFLLSRKSKSAMPVLSPSKYFMSGRKQYTMRRSSHYFLK